MNGLKWTVRYASCIVIRRWTTAHALCGLKLIFPTDPRVRGLGAVRLDLTSPQSECADQHLVLDKVRKHLTLDRVLALHNRTQEASHESVALFYHLECVHMIDQPYHCFLEVKGWALSQCLLRLHKRSTACAGED